MGLLYNVLGSGVVALFMSAIKAPAAGTFVGAALVAVVTAYVMAPGRYQWLRIISAAALAFLIPFAVVTIGELILGHSIANPDRSTTYSVPGEDKPESTGHVPQTPIDPKTPQGIPAIQVTPNPLACDHEVAVGSSDLCGELTVLSTGQAPLKVTHFDAPTSADFRVDDLSCLDAILIPGASCKILVTFEPKGEGKRTGSFVIHQNIPAPDKGMTVELSGFGGPAAPISGEPIPTGHAEEAASEGEAVGP